MLLTAARAHPIGAQRTIPNAASVGSDGLYAVKITFDDKAVARKLSLGSGGTAAIYTKHGRPVHII
jgi:membrane fusion protein, multidrug efflux system